MIPSWMLIPFATMLLGIAVFPLLPKVGEWWEDNVHKLLISVVLGIPVVAWMWMHKKGDILVEQIWNDYVPFILLLMSLFVTTGGIHIKGDLKANPVTNTTILAIGWALASFMGTTGAAMLLIRLLLETIKQRKYKVHTMLFFIAIVANCGGLLSPLGDPPLFLLFQKGASFTWWMQNMIGEWLVTGVLLLLVYFIVDTYYYGKEPIENLQKDDKQQKKLQFSGLHNLAWLILIILVAMFINPTNFPVLGNENAPFLIRSLRKWIFMAIIFGSWITTPEKVRKANSFTWKPIIEVACVFLGIFITMTPALMFLHQMKEPIQAVLNEPWQYVYTTGLLSAFLDNAPTAMIFNEMAPCGAIAGLAEDAYLKAISMGAVFFGSLTYIGNGPNFMVKAIAEENHIEMPSFFGYMIRFSLIVCLPIYIITQLIFI